MTLARLGNRTAPRKLVGGPPPSFGKPRVGANIQGLSDRAATTQSTRNALAKFGWVQWGFYRDAALVTAGEQSIANVRAQNPSGIHSLYTIVSELGGQTGGITSITRSGSTVTVTTDNFQSGTNAGSIFGIFGTSNFRGQWTATSASGSAGGTGTIQFTASGSAASAANETGLVSKCFYQLANTANYTLVQKADAMNWFDRKQGASGPLMSWTTAFGTYDMTLGDWLSPDANGDRWVDYKAKDDATFFFAKCAGLDFAFLDNYNDLRDDIINDAAFPGQRGKGDWKRTGVLQNRTDADIAAAHRAGYARVAAIHRAASVGRAKSPNLKVMGNCESTFANSGWENTIEAAMCEGLVGASYSQATTALQLAQHDMIRGRLLAPALMLINGQGSSVTNYKDFRRAFCTALMRPTSWFFYSQGGTYDNFTWYNEYDAQLGLPVDVEPTAAWNGSVWRLRFQNGWVLLNDGATTANLDLSAFGLRRMGASDFTTAVQDATQNSGAAVTTLNLAAKDGIVLLYA